MSAILLINLGTSDLTVKYNDYYLPLGLSDLPVVPTETPDPDDTLNTREQEIWDNRLEIIATEICWKLGVPFSQNLKSRKLQFSFRELTKAIVENPDLLNMENISFHPGGRVLGVISAALKLNLNLSEIHFFYTDQNSDANFHDTVYLYEILKKLFADKIDRTEWNFEIKSYKIPVKDNTTLKDVDQLLELYGSYIDSLPIDRETILLVSQKGGTPQMYTALRIQALASKAKCPLFINPRISRKRILLGEESKCTYLSYWRGLKTQKYATTKLLLEKRWDFDGARVILEEWLETLSFVQEKTQDQSIQIDSESIQKAIELCNKATNYLNLDKSILNRPQKNFYTWLNLYTQCKISWELHEIANLLTRLGSFCESILISLITNLAKDCITHDKIYKEKCDKKSKNIFQKFKELETQQGEFTSIFRHETNFGVEVIGEASAAIGFSDNEIIKWKRALEDECFHYSFVPEVLIQKNIKLAPNKSNNKKYDFRVRLVHRPVATETVEVNIVNQLTSYLIETVGEEHPRIELKTRHKRRNFLNAFLSSTGNDQQKESLAKILSALKKIEYWIDVRNDLIHSAKGLSKTSMDQQRKVDIQTWNEAEHNSFKADPRQSCTAEEILNEMIKMCEASADLLGVDISPYLSGNPKNYYLYSDLQQEICELLN